MENKKPIVVSQEAKKVEAKVETVVEGLKQILTAEDIDVLATKVLGKMISTGVRKNIRNKVLTQDKVKAQIGRILRDIKNSRNGWWNTYEIVDTKDTFGIKAKPVLIQAQ